MNSVILGNGQVANALVSNFKQSIEKYDKGEWEDLKIQKTNILHICIPYNEHFYGIVKKAELVFNPTFTIIHSTVKVGTTETLNASYSPVLGRHNDDFKKNINQYVKPFAGSKTACEAFKKEYSKAIGYVSIDTQSLEYAKQMSTNYMYWNLVFQKMVHADCKKYGFSFKDVYTKWNLNYNKGIKQKHEDWQRPIYDYDSNHQAGGHCLGANIYLDDYFISKFLREWHETGGIQLLHRVKDGK
jgi:hypothetical protein